MGNLMNKVMGVPSKRKQAAEASVAKEKASAREADEAKDSDANVLESETSDVATAGTDVAVVRAKKTARKGVPGLGL